MDAARARAWRELLRLDARGEAPARTGEIAGQPVVAERARAKRNSGYRFETYVPPPRPAEIAGELVLIEQAPRRIRFYRPRFANRQLTLRWRVLPRAKGYSLGTDPLTAKEKALSKRLRLHLLPPLPKTRGDCVNGPRPCPHLLCRHHLAVDLNYDTGSAKLNHPDPDAIGHDLVPLDELEDTCSLDVADRVKDKGMTLEHVGFLMGLTLERIRQLEKEALAEVHAKHEPPGRPVEPNAPDVDAPEAEQACPDCDATDPLLLAHTEAPSVEVISDPANADAFACCIIAGANRPKPSWSWCATSGYFSRPGVERVQIVRERKP